MGGGAEELAASPGGDVRAAGEYGASAAAGSAGDPGGTVVDSAAHADPQRPKVSATPASEWALVVTRAAILRGRDSAQKKTTKPL
jgi:hypothetical protein